MKEMLMTFPSVLSLHKKSSCSSVYPYVGLTSVLLIAWKISPQIGKLLISNHYSQNTT